MMGCISAPCSPRVHACGAGASLCRLVHSQRVACSRHSNRPCSTREGHATRPHGRSLLAIVSCCNRFWQCKRTSRTADAAVLILMTSSAASSASAARSTWSRERRMLARKPGRLPTALPAWARGASAAWCTMPYSDETAPAPRAAQRARWCSAATLAPPASSCSAAGKRMELAAVCSILLPTPSLTCGTCLCALAGDAWGLWEGLEALKSPERECRLPLTFLLCFPAALLCSSGLATTRATLQALPAAPRLSAPSACISTVSLPASGSDAHVLLTGCWAVLGSWGDLPVSVTGFSAAREFGSALSVWLAGSLLDPAPFHGCDLMYPPSEASLATGAKPAAFGWAVSACAASGKLAGAAELACRTSSLTRACAWSACPASASADGTSESVMCTLTHASSSSTTCDWPAVLRWPASERLAVTLGPSRPCCVLAGRCCALLAAPVMSVWLQCLSQKALRPEPAPSRSPAAPGWRPISADASSPAPLLSLMPPVFAAGKVASVEARVSSGRLTLRDGGAAADGSVPDVPECWGAASLDSISGPGSKAATLAAGMSSGAAADVKIAAPCSMPIHSMRGYPLALNVTEPHNDRGLLCCWAHNVWRCLRLDLRASYVSDHYDQLVNLHTFRGSTAASSSALMALSRRGAIFRYAV